MAIEAQQLVKRFGGTVALDHVSFTLDRMSITGLVGPNGSGKTTLLRCMSGFLTPDAGVIRLFGQSGVQPHQLARHGVAQTFQRLALVDDMTVAENVAVALDGQAIPTPRRLGLDLFGLDRGLDAIDVEALLVALEVAHLEGFADQLVGNLPLGVRRRVELGRALAARPRLLLLDEPTSGLDERETSALVDMIEVVAARAQITVVLVEHDIDVVSRLCDRALVLNFGHLIFDGPTAEAFAAADVKRAYLGQ